MTSKNNALSLLARNLDATGDVTADAIASTVSFGVDVYDSIGLLPYVGNTSGNQAFVSSTSRLYIWQGSGWYSIALINRAPTISSVLDSDGGTTPFTLSSDGTATTITITANDSDGDPITYTASADSDFNGLATVSQDSSVFTITPFSEDSATTTSGTITFKATDGVNIASSGVQTFTLVFLGPYDIANATHIGSISLTSQISIPYGLTAKSDGTKLYVNDLSSDKIYQYSLSTAFDVSTATYDNKSYAYGTHDITGWTLKPDGTRMWGSLSYSASLTNRIIQYDLSTPYDVSTMSVNGIYEVSGPSGIAFKSDGTKCYIMRRSNYTIYEHTLSTPWDITSIGASSGSFYVATFDNSPYEIDLSTDGTKIFMIGDQNDRVYQIDMSTAFDITTASYNNINFHLASDFGLPWAQSYPNGLYMSPDGNRMIIGGQYLDLVSSFNIE